MAAMLKALPREGSRLKILTLQGDEAKHAAALAYVREAGVTVKMETIDLDDTYNGDDNHDHYDDDTENYQDIPSSEDQMFDPYLYSCG